MRDLLMLGAMSVLVPLSISNGFIAYVLWAWTALFSPNYYLYGFMSGVRYNFLFAGIALLALLLGKRRSPLRFTSTQKWLIVFLVHASLCAAFAYSPNRLNAEIYEGLVKAMVFCLVLPAFVDSRMRLHVLLVALAMGLSFHGVVEGAKFILSAGGHKITGIPTTMMSDNNHFAVGLLMIVPVLYYLYQYSAHRLVRLAFLGAFAITALAVVGTFSRGGFIGLVVVATWLVLSSRRKFYALATIAVVSALLLLAAPDAWFARIDTLNDAGEDSSFMGRVNAWKISLVVALNNPVFGGGFHSIQAQHIWSTFREAIQFLDFIPTPPTVETARAAHSIYFEVLGDTGFVGLLLCLAIWINAWRTALWIKRAIHDQAELVWARDLSDMLRVALLVYAISGAAVSMAYFELFYIFAALIAALEQYVVRHLAQVPVPVPASSVELISVPTGSLYSRSSR